MTGSAILTPASAEADLESWGDPPRSAPGAPILSADGFEGPLDWLLEMARAKKIDLARLPIAALIGSFADALQAALARPAGVEPDLSRWGDWLVMAATLALLRSRLMLQADAAATSEAEDLRRHLVGRAQIRAAADWLERRPQLGEFFRRGRPETRPGARGADITDLLRACLTQLRVPDAVADAYRIRPLPFWGVPQAIERIEALLCARPEGELTDFLPAIAETDRDRRCRAAVASTLVAGLELARRGSIAIEQNAPMGPLHLRRTPAEL